MDFELASRPNAFNIQQRAMADVKGTLILDWVFTILSAVFMNYISLVVTTDAIGYIGILPNVKHQTDLAWHFL